DNSSPSGSDTRMCPNPRSPEPATAVPAANRPMATAGACSFNPLSPDDPFAPIVAVRCRTVNRPPSYQPIAPCPARRAGAGSTRDEQHAGRCRDGGDVPRRGQAADVGVDAETHERVAVLVRRGREPPCGVVGEGAP